MHQYKRYPHKIGLGKVYLVTIFDKPIHVQFIQPTPCGYNFLNLKTSKCVLQRHVYPQKGRPKPDTFWLGEYVSILKEYDGNEASQILQNFHKRKQFKENEHTSNSQASS